MKCIGIKDKKVLFLELGSYPDEIKGSGLQTLPMMRVHYTDSKLAIVREVGCGGSSFSFYATAFDPPAAMLSKYGIDLSEETEAIKKELPVDTLSDDLVGPMAGRIMKSAQDLGYDWQKLNKFVDQSKCKPDCALCTYGCPYGAKWTARKFIEEAENNGSTVLSKAKANRVIFENRKRRRKCHWEEK